MGNLTKKIIETFETEDLADDLDAICLAAELICKTTFVDYVSSFDEVEEETITDQEAEKLETSIITALEHYRDQNKPEVVSSLLLALSKTGKKQYKEVYQEYLRHGFESFLSYNQIVYHTLLALSDCEDEITVLDWKDGQDGTVYTGLGCTEHDKIASLAWKYLKAVGKSPFD